MFEIYYFSKFFHDLSCTSEFEAFNTETFNVMNYFVDTIERIQVK